MRPKRESIGVVQWIAWLLATVTAAVTLVVFVYTNFTTKAEATVYQDSLEKRLDRLETKIDRLISK